MILWHAMRPAHSAERAAQTSRRKEIYEALHPETSEGGPGRAKATRRQIGDDMAERFSASTAQATGRSERDIQRDAERGEKVVGDRKCVPREGREPMTSALDVEKFRKVQALARSAPPRSPSSREHSDGILPAEIVRRIPALIRDNPPNGQPIPENRDKSEQGLGLTNCVGISKELAAITQIRTPR